MTHKSPKEAKRKILSPGDSKTWFFRAWKSKNCKNCELNNPIDFDGKFVCDIVVVVVFFPSA